MVAIKAAISNQAWLQSEPKAVNSIKTGTITRAVFLNQDGGN
jgi:hypothetical protein